MSDLFSCVHGEDDIWYLRFNKISRAAVADYIHTINLLNQKIVSGEIITHNPIRTLWDFTSGRLPQLQNLVLQAKLNPPPADLGYRIAYLINDATTSAELEAFRGYFKTDQIDRRSFFEKNRAEAIRWLLEI